MPQEDQMSLAEDLRALRRGCGAHRLSRDAVSVAGPEAEGYLQGQCSQDVVAIVVGGAAWTLVLEPDGKLSGLARVTRTAGDAFLLDVDAGFGEQVAARLRRFKLRTKVEIDTLAMACVALRGAEVPDMEKGPAGGVWPVAFEWNGVRGVDLLGSGAEALVPAGARWCGSPAWEALRVEAGIPAMGRELDARTIAAEAGLVERTVSFAKGCYTGQELVARLDARGNRVARRLCGVVPEAPGQADPAGWLTGAELRVAGGDKVVGRCTSAAVCPGVGGVAALAYVHRSVAVGDRVLARAAGGGPGTGEVPAEVRSLPLVPG